MILGKDPALNDRDSATDKNQETEASEADNSDILLKKHTETYGSSPSED